MQNYWYAPGWRQYKAALAHHHPTSQLVLSEAPVALGDQTDTTIAAVTAAPAKSPAAAAAAVYEKVPVVLAYATVTGNTQQYAETIARILMKGDDIQASSHNASLRPTFCTLHAAVTHKKLSCKCT